MSSMSRALALAQGTYWTATGLWPVLHLKSFARVTGPKPEGWLVKTAGALIASIGTSLLMAGLRRRVGAESKWLGFSSAMAMASVDLFYTAIRRIKPVYLADAPVELALAVGWALTARPRRLSTTQTAALEPETDLPATMFAPRDVRPRHGSIAPGETLRPDGTRDLVEEASMESFPASDPPSVGQSC